MKTEGVTASRPVTPSTIIAHELRELTDLLVASDHLEPDVKRRLRRVRDLAEGLDPYLDRCTTPESSALSALALRTHQVDWASRALVFGSGPLEHEMLSGHVEGQWLKFLVHMTRATRVLEIGMFTGYSALAMAEALPSDGEIVACEVDDFVAEFARSCFSKSPVGHSITVEQGPAIETLHRLDGRVEPFDLVFVDADKTGYLGYYQLLMDSDLLAVNGIVAVDNTLMQGQPYADDNGRTVNGDAIAEFNRFVAEDARVEQVLLPLRDGVTLIRRVREHSAWP